MRNGGGQNLANIDVHLGHLVKAIIRQLLGKAMGWT